MAILDALQTRGILYQPSVNGATSEGAEAYRGELILIPGKINATGNQSPPEMLVKQGLLLAKDGKITFLAGFVHKLAHLNTMAEILFAECSDTAQFFFYVENINKSLNVSLQDRTLTVFPLDEGTVWNELIDSLNLEKGDFKGLSAPDKVEKVADEALSFKPAFDTMSMADAEGLTFKVEKETRGPV